MQVLKIAIIIVLATLGSFAVASSASAQVSVFTEHQVISMFQHAVNKNIAVPFRTGNYPYIGRAGVEYKHQNWGFQFGYIHRSNVDLSGTEYNYDGVSLGIKYEHCIYGC